MSRSALSLFAALAAVAPAFGLSVIPPISYTKDSSCGKFRFVMLTKLGANAEALAKQYPASGRYRVGAAPVPLWTVTWYAYEQRVVPLTDGVHLVVHPGNGYDGYPPGLSFHADGKLVNQYAPEELAEIPWLMLGTDDGSGTRRIRINQGTVDEAAYTYHLAPDDGSTCTFDIRTGKIIAESRPWLRGGLILGVLLLGAILLAVWWWRTRPKDTPAAVAVGA